MFWVIETDTNPKGEAKFVAIYQVVYSCGGNRCADCRNFRQNSTSVVTVSVG